MSKSFGPVLFYEKPIPLPKMVRVWDQAPEQLSPELEKKLAQVVSLLEKLVAEDRPAVADVMSEKKRQRHENARRLRERGMCGLTSLQDAIRRAEFDALCEFAESAYSDRNPHKKQREVPRDSRVQYPHQPRQREPWEGRLAAQDGTARFMTACEQSEAAYAARNPHKRCRER